MIRIKTKKEVNSNGELGRRILEVDLLGKEKLPKKYLNGECIYRSSLSENSIYYIDKYGRRVGWTIPVTEWKSEADFQRALSIIRECGDRLHKINKELAVLRETWNGEETFTI